MTAAQPGSRPDLGRLVMVPAAALVLAADVLALARAGGASGVIPLTGTVLICVFYVVVIWCYLRRRQAVATSSSVTAHIAAVAGTLAPFVFPQLPRPPASAGWLAAGDLLLVAGTAWSLWSLWSLGRSLSMLAQAREVVTRGPYRWVRHPLYSGEIVSALGLALIVRSTAAAAVWLALCTLQAYRAAREEQVLLRALPAYHGYRSRTAALLPGIF